jgi:carbamoyl-phosphate synthase large subunit
MRLDGADPTLGVEMASTGEVGCLGDDFEEAFLKALLSVGYQVPVRSILLSTGPIEDKASFLESARILERLGISLFATRGTADFLLAHDVKTTLLHWPLEQQTPNTLEFISQRQFDLVINVPKNFQEDELTNDYLIRRRAVDFGIPLITNIQLAQRFVEALERKQSLVESLEIKSWSEYQRPVV